MKKIVSLFLCCIFVLSLTGCSDPYQDAVKPDDMSEEYFEYTIKLLRIIDDRLLGKTTVNECENAKKNLSASLKNNLSSLDKENKKYKSLFSFNSDILDYEGKDILSVPIESVKETVDGRNNLAVFFFIPPIKLEDTQGYKVLNKYLPDTIDKFLNK